MFVCQWWWDYGKRRVVSACCGFWQHASSSSFRKGKLGKFYRGYFYIRWLKPCLVVHRTVESGFSFFSYTCMFLCRWFYRTSLIHGKLENGKLEDLIMNLITYLLCGVLWSANELGESFCTINMAYRIIAKESGFYIDSVRYHSTILTILLPINLSQ